MTWFKKRWWLALLVITAIISFNYFKNKFGNFKEIEKNDRKYFISNKYNGVIFKKTHNIKSDFNYSVLIHENNKQVLVDFGVEIPIFEYVQIGDSIAKQSGDLAVDVFRGGVKDTTMMIYFD